MKPIFIHSLFRSGSTYIFNKFRQSEAGYWCYQEPFNEHLICAKREPQKLLEKHSEVAQYLRHPKIDKPYFYEFYCIYEKVAQFYCKEFAYDQYFCSDNGSIGSVKAYVGALIESAKGRPMLQFCRSVGRVSILKELFPSTVNIFLWRNPWDQWWSHKIGFEANLLLIVNSIDTPPFLKWIKRKINLPEYHSTDILEEYNYFRKRWIASYGSYLIFYALWCYALLEARPHCEIDINIDNLTNSSNYRHTILHELTKHEITGIDFEDCHVPQMVYGEFDKDFFEKIENEVYGLLLAHGYSVASIESIIRLRKEYSADNTISNGMKGSADDGGWRIRKLAMQYEAELNALFIKDRENLEKTEELV